MLFLAARLNLGAASIIKIKLRRFNMKSTASFTLVFILIAIEITIAQDTNINFKKKPTLP